MISIFKKQRPASVLALSLSGNQIEAIVVRRVNGSLRVQQTAVADLALSPLGGDPELVGREIRNHLDKAGIRERRCALSIPPAWVLTLRVKLPDLPEADLASFLEIESERGFHSGAENLHIVKSRYKLSNGEQYVTLLGVQRNHLETLEKILKAAQLKPLTFSPGVAALDFPERNSSDAAFALVLGSHSLDLLAVAGGGIAVLRSLDAALESESAQRGIDTELVAREIRITLGQFPADVAEKIRMIRVFGRGETARHFSDQMTSLAEGMGLKVQLMERASAASFEPPLTPEMVSSSTLALAANWLKAASPLPELLPPKVTPWRQFLSGKQTSKKLAWAGGLAGAAVLFLCAGFIYQSWRITHLESRWDMMSAKVGELQADQEQMKKYAPWFDRTYRGMRILAALANAFPEDGYVSAKTVEIRDLTTVSCSGFARDNQSFIVLSKRLQESKEVSNFKTDTLRGQSPVQFSFEFQWEGASGN